MLLCHSQSLSQSRSLFRFLFCCCYVQITGKLWCVAVLIRNLSGCFAGQRSSGYLAILMLLPFSLPVLRFFATRFPDKALLRVRSWPPHPSLNNCAHAYICGVRSDLVPALIYTCLSVDLITFCPVPCLYFCSPQNPQASKHPLNTCCEVCRLIKRSLCFGDHHHCNVIFLSVRHMFNPTACTTCFEHMLCGLQVDKAHRTSLQTTIMIFLLSACHMFHPAACRTCFLNPCCEDCRLTKHTVRRCRPPSRYFYCLPAICFILQPAEHVF
jgi:hypothetical protein